MDLNDRVVNRCSVWPALTCCLIAAVVVAMFVVRLASPGWAQTQPAPREYRVDTFDTRGNRTGYHLIKPETGRIDSFDTRSRRTGSGQITPLPGRPAPASPPSAPVGRWR
jgi:hypothetical protein